MVVTVSPLRTWTSVVSSISASKNHHQPHQGLQELKWCRCGWLKKEAFSLWVFWPQPFSSLGGGGALLRFTLPSNDVFIFRAHMNLIYKMEQLLIHFAGLGIQFADKG